MINNMEKVLKLGLMVHNMRVNMLEEKNMGEVNLNGLTGLNLKETLMIIILKEKDNILGQMVESMLENTPKIRRKAMENSFGPMVDAIEVNG